ncbi:MAG TPA: hypothetical protein VKR61_06220 [Bryobacteraceae bacterium]|nr:hypothetical protein [Bryobacteraceae bacterium]
MTGTAKRAMACGAGCALSAVLLAPCFWQPRIQAGDLSSHLYNAWLAQLIERGQAPGLTLAHQSNNVLFDLMLGGLMGAWGPAAAQRIAVSFAVLVFFWGAFAFVGSCPRPWRAPWQLAPCLAILAYGWVFRMGLFNFYISLGLSLGAMALARRNRRWAWAFAALLWGIAYVAHPMPVAWSAGVLIYGRVARALAPRHRIRLLIGALAALAFTGFLLDALFPTRRGADQVMSMTGADQLWIYGKYYIAVSLAMLAVWALSFQRVLAVRGAKRTLLDSRFQLCVLSAASLVLLPCGVLLPGFRSGLDFVAERMSLAGAVLFCGLLATVRLPKPIIGAMAALALVFFGLSYADERALNSVETQMERAITQLPPGQRVVSMLADPESRIKSLAHLVDRICVGRCFSYANYEPATAQFRVRADHVNPFVVSDYGESWTIQTGGYVVKPSDLPLYNVDLCQAGSPRICVAPLRAGAMLRNTGLRVVPILGGG